MDVLLASHLGKLQTRAGMLQQHLADDDVEKMLRRGLADTAFWKNTLVQISTN